MATNDVCPQCGTPVSPGATACTACGHSLTAGREPSPVSTPPASQDAPVAPNPPPEAEPARSTPAPSAPKAVLIDVSAIFNETRERWGVAQPHLLLAALALASIAFAVSTLANISYLTAGDNSQLQKFDAQVWFQFALGAAIGSAALLVLVRRQAGIPPAGTGSAVDLRGGYVLAGLTMAFSLAGLFKGMDESFEAQDSWFGYARVFGFLAIGWFAVSRPVPEAIGAVKPAMVGLVALGVSGLALAIGQIQGLSEDNSTYLSGISFQQLGSVGMLLSFGWFLGLRPTSAG